MEITINIEQVLREEIRKILLEKIDFGTEIEIVSDPEPRKTITVATTGQQQHTPAASTTKPAINKAPSNITWEFGPRPGTRRNPEQIALHDLELKLGRNLTPEEKGEAKAHVEIDETAEEKAKQDTLKKVRIDEMAKQGMDAASKELAEEAAAEEPGGKVFVNGEEQLPASEEPSIPTTEKLNTDSLFS
jgi:hypothetical protein